MQLSLCVEVFSHKPWFAKVIGRSSNPLSGTRQVCLEECKCLGQCSWFMITEPGLYCYFPSSEEVSPFRYTKIGQRRLCGSGYVLVYENGALEEVNAFEAYMIAEGITEEVTVPVRNQLQAQAEDLMFCYSA